ncbi:hypothetical protein M413DRAFT_20193 [Hebeloma cylindrosporum]|uniref:Copper transport protein n=1 Tax=Hebeloma cylindrosporum TaxID=76867 RepID=A0A0C2XIQ5_HEBCY|nr:hypothetical protein M413DRAFT_20193 [Hebeloma cylindrosporum h7]
MSSLMRVATLFVLLCILPSAVVTHSDGMDMSMDGSMSLASGTMKPYLHFTPGDVIWFLGWVPQSRGAMAGASIGLFLLALVDRWLAAIRASAESHWRRRLNSAANDTKRSSNTRLIPSRILHTSLPFIPAHDIARGILQVGQVALGFAFMLVIMTYQAAFIISIVVGMGVGEMLFGRYISAGSTH